MSRWDDTPAPRGEDYDAQWRDVEAAGGSVHGEADFVTDLGPTTVLDAGCGTGRVAIELARRGIETLGVDRDPAMLATARRKAPDLAWVEQDLAELEPATVPGTPSTFDVVVAAGNVMIFLAAGTEAAVVARLADLLTTGGALVAGFSLTHAGYGLDAYDADCAAVGLVLEQRFATWERGSWSPGADYAVSVHRRVAGTQRP